MILVVVPRQIKSSGSYGLDPAFFPLLLLWLVVGLGVLLVATRLAAPGDPDGARGGLSVDNWKFIVGAAAFLWLGYEAINLLGFVIAGTLMIAVLMVLIDGNKTRLIEVAALALIAPFAIYWLLFNVFHVQLPSGPF